MEARGQINQYVPYKSPDGPPVYTVNLANGVTPFIKHFNGREHNSSCYRLDLTKHGVVPTYTNGFIRLNVAHAWYRPSPVEFDLLDKESQDHVLNGGLLPAELPQAVAAQMFGDPVQCEWDYERFQAWCLDTYGRRLGPLEKP